MNNATEMQGTRSGTIAMFAFGAVVGAVLTALVIGNAVAARDYSHALEELGMAQLALNSNQKTMAPQLREYLKGRLYWNAAVWVPKGALSGMKIDFGPIDENVLGLIAIAKDGSRPAEVYQAAIEKHLRVGK